MLDDEGRKAGPGAWGHNHRVDRTREQARYEAERLLIWAGEPGRAGGWRAEVAEVEFGDGALCASGTELD